MTLIRAETERYDIADFSKSLASATGSWESNKLGESRLAGDVLPAEHVSLHPGACIRRVLEKRPEVFVCQ